MTKLTVLLFISLFFLGGCSPFGGDKETRKVLSDGLSPKALYDKARDKLDAGSIDQAIDQFELILSTYPTSKYAIQSRLDIAYNLFKRKKYNRAINKLDDYIERYPALPSTPYAYYLRGVISEEKSSSILDDILTDNAQRDVKSIRDAYGYYLSLIEKFPDSKYSKDALKKLNNLRNTLARHEFYVAIFYTRTGSHIAAINRSKYIIENYSGSPIVADGLHLMAYNYDIVNTPKLAEDARKVLFSNYPNYSPIYSID